MHRSLLVRLSVLTLAVIVVSVAATAWLAALVLNRGIQQASGQSRAEIASVYGTLLHYGATHRDWAGAGPVADSLSRRTGQQIELADLSDHRLAFASAAPEALPLGSPVAVVDPLHVDPSLDPGAPASRIDPAVAGPLAPSAQDKTAFGRLARSVLSCMKGKGGGRVVLGLLGQPEVQGTDPALAGSCGADKLASTIMSDQEPAFAALTLATPPGQQRALVFSPHNELRIAEVAAAIIALAIGATLLAGFRLVRPLRALTAAARGVEANGFTEVAEVSGNDEIAHLTRAFNHLARTQTQMEEQRKIAISDIAHELRTPLANIRAWLEAARDGLADNDSELARSLLEEAMLLQRTVDDLQLLSLADAGQLKLHLQDVPLATLLRQARAALSGPAETAGVTINLACPDTVVVADPDRLRQIVQNLVSNAIRHSRPAGFVHLRATINDECLRLDVIDHGAGITATDLPRIYDRFWRAEKSRSRAAGGSGLGLAIVRQLVEAHGGTVSARSIPGEETVFSVLIPTPAHPPGQDPAG